MSQESGEPLAAGTVSLVIEETRPGMGVGVSFQKRGAEWRLDR
jgi:hypothetical protein